METRKYTVVRGQRADGVTCDTYVSEDADTTMDYTPFLPNGYEFVRILGEVVMVLPDCHFLHPINWTLTG